MRVIKIALKGILILISVLLISAITTYFVLDEPIPQGQNNVDADKLAKSMLSAINYEAWDSTHFVSWSMHGLHQYLWDKQNNFVQVRWEDKMVLLNVNNITGKVFENKKLVEGNDVANTIQTAWEYFCNDAFG